MKLPTFLNALRPTRSGPARARKQGRRALDATLDTIREDERTHIARELHDDLGQLLATLRVELSLLRQLPAGSPAAQEITESMDQLLLTAIVSLRRIAGNLRPLALEQDGLLDALQALCRKFEQRHSIHCRLDALPRDLALDDGLSTAIYRLVQEALTNIARHAGASQALLRLLRQDGVLQMEISDNGRGIGSSDMAKRGAFGLLGMRERVDALGGTIVVQGSPAGTRIDIRIPVPD